MSGFKYLLLRFRIPLIISVIVVATYFCTMFFLPSSDSDFRLGQVWALCASTIVLCMVVSISVLLDFPGTGSSVVFLIAAPIRNLTMSVFYSMGILFAGLVAASVVHIYRGAVGYGTVLFILVQLMLGAAVLFSRYFFANTRHPGVYSLLSCIAISQVISPALFWRFDETKAFLILGGIFAILCAGGVSRHFCGRSFLYDRYGFLSKNGDQYTALVERMYVLKDD